MSDHSPPLSQTPAAHIEPAAPAARLPSLGISYSANRILKDSLGVLMLAAALGAMVHFFIEPDDRNLLSEHGIFVPAAGLILAAAGVYLLRLPKAEPYLLNFAFEGGFMDGRKLVADLRKTGHAGRLDEAVRYYMSTDRGKVGRRLWSGSDFAMAVMKSHGTDVAALQAASRDPRFQCQQYEIIKHEETDRDIHVTARFVA